MATADEPPLSQASSHFAIEPVSAAVLATRERARRDGVRRRGAVMTGCGDVDEGALLGGLERGSVVGISAEDEGVGMQIVFQAVARSLVDGERAMVVTTLTAGGVLPLLRDAVRARLTDGGREGKELTAGLRDCLGRVSVSTVFDLEGVWEAIGEVDVDDTREDGVEKTDDDEGDHDVQQDTRQVEREGSPSEDGEKPALFEPNGGMTPFKGPGQDMTPPPAAQGSQTYKKIILPELKPGKREIADSEDEDGLSSLSSSPLSSPPASSLGSMPPSLDDQEIADGLLGPASAEPEVAAQRPVSMSASAADTTDTGDSDNIETQEAAMDNTIIQSPSPSQSSSPRNPPDPIPAGPHREAARPPTAKQAPTSTAPDIILITHFSTILTTLFTRQEKSSAHNAIQLLSSHLRHLSRALPSSPLIMLLNSTAPSSIDAPAQPADTPSRKNSSRPLGPTLRSIFNPPQLPMAGYHNVASRRNKPSFGMVFAQILDLHLLCTRVPRGADDAERVFGDAPGEAKFVWVVEVLLDEIGVWEGKRGPRRSREQRWGAVDVVKGRVVNAFEAKGPRAYKEIRLAAGFGGPRV